MPKLVVLTAFTTITLTFATSAAQADIIYNWSFGTAAGTMTFTGVDLGTSHTGLAPSSIVQTMGPTATPYSLNDNILTQSWNTFANPSSTAWAIAADGTVNAGLADFVHNGPGLQRFTLSTSTGGSFVVSGGAALASGTASFAAAAAAVPEPSSLMCLGALGLGLAFRRRPKKNLIQITKGSLVHLQKSYFVLLAALMALSPAVVEADIIGGTPSQLVRHGFTFHYEASGDNLSFQNFRDDVYDVSGIDEIDSLLAQPVSDRVDLYNELVGLSTHTGPSSFTLIYEHGGTTQYQFRSLFNNGGFSGETQSGYNGPSVWVSEHIIVSAAAAVPEPSSLMCLGALGMGMMAYRRRKA